MRNNGLFLHLAAALWLLPIIMGPSLNAQLSGSSRRAIDDPLGKQKSRVIEVRDPYAVRGTDVYLELMTRMLNTGICELSGYTDPNVAWRTYLHQDDVIALKFNRIASREFGTNKAMAGVLLDILYGIGFSPDQFLIVGLDQLPEQAAGTRKFTYGWQREQADFGSGSDHLATWVSEVTAIVNIPTFMDDNVTGLRGAMANVTWPLMKSPARPQHFLACGDPFIPEVYALAEIQGKIRLTIANGLHVLYYGGPIVDKRFAAERQAVVFCDDPVAMDRIGLEMIRNFRRTLIMPEGVDPKINAGYLLTAEAMGIGYQDFNLIDYRWIRPDKLK